MSDWGGRLVEIDGIVVRLTRGEMAVLATLMEAAPEPVPRDVLDAAARLGAATRGGRKRLVDQRVHTLRQKLGDDARRPRLIVSIVGIGYAFGKGAVAATG